MKQANLIWYLLFLLLVASSSLKAQTVGLKHIAPNYTTTFQPLTTTITAEGEIFTGASLYFDIGNCAVSNVNVIDGNHAELTIDPYYWATPNTFVDVSLQTSDQFGQQFNYIIPSGFFIQPNYYPNHYAAARVFNDQDQNGLYNGSEPLLVNQVVCYTYQYWDHPRLCNKNLSSGFVQIPIYDSTAYDSELQAFPESQWTVTTAPHIYSPPLDDSPMTYWKNVGLYTTDFLKVDLRASAPACNKDRTTTIDLQNYNIHPSDSGWVRYIKPSNAVYVSSNPLADNVLGDTVFWSYSEIITGEIKHFEVTLHLPGEGDTLYHSVTAYGVADSGAITDLASDTLVQIVLCPTKPNWKTVNRDTIYVNNDSLTYTLFFQNTWTDTATLVVIRDTLSPYVNGFALRSSSHPVQVTWEAGGVVTFTFDNIQLPDSITSPAGSQGYVTFRVKANNVNSGTHINNIASVYYDSHPRIRTTLAQTVYCNTQTTNETAHICNGDSISIGGVWRNTAGVYAYHTSTPWICDYVHLVTLTVTQVDTNVVVQDSMLTAAPSGIFYQWYDCLTNLPVSGANAQTFIPAVYGYYSVRVYGGNGCYARSGCHAAGSCAPITTEQSLTICNGEAVWIGSNMHNAPGTYTDVLTASNFCDSTVITHLSVASVDTAVVANDSTLSVASGAASYQWFNCITSQPIPGADSSIFLATTDGSYSVLVTNTSGCPAMSHCVTVGTCVTVETEQDVALCPGEEVNVGSHVYTQSGTYTDVLQTYFGCDSIVITNVDVLNVNTEASIDSNNVLTAPAGAVTYQWYDCISGLPVTGATAQVFTPMSNGLYQVSVSMPNGCSAVSPCYVVIILATESIEDPSIAVYPNPTNEILTISSDHRLVTWKLVSIDGRVQQEETVSADNLKRYNVNMSRFHQGVYWLQVKTIGGTYNFKIIKI